jgi:hypothetical protein
VSDNLLESQRTTKRRPRIIDILRKHYPGEWRYVAQNHWSGPFDVRGYSVSAGMGDITGDGSFMTVYYREDTHRPVDELWPKIRFYYA